MPGRPWGIRSIPEIDSRYPLWDQPDLVRHIDEGRFYLPDAEEGLRETLVTTVIDARPIQCQRLPGPSFIPLIAAVTTGGFFVFGTFHRWWLAVASLVVATGVIAYWLWTGTAPHPEKEEKDVGLGLRLPLYLSGSTSVGWWGLFITLLADLAAFLSLVFGYFFYWTARDDFPPDPVPGPGATWPSVGALLVGCAWGLSVLARRLNRADRGAAFHAAVLLAIAAAAGCAFALVAGPWRAGLDPRAHAYGAIVWLLLAWAALHVVVGVLMLLYCAASRLRGRMTARRDIDVCNVVLYWHFAAFTVLVAAAVVAGFPRLG